MKITVLGVGYVGLVTGTCLSEMGNHVLCFDIDRRKIESLQQGAIPIHERGLQPMLERNAAAGRLKFTSDVGEAVAHGALQFICVGTPSTEDGSADLAQVLAAARSIGERMEEHKIIVNKSTVPVGTADRVEAAVAQCLRERGCEHGFAVVSNPEFLKEGVAVEDFMRPDRIVLGASDAQAIALLRTVYAPFTRNRDRLHVMDARSAELTKYAANAMLATRISFMNDLALLAEAVGADIELVRHGIGSDPRIGTHFLYPGVGFGGSCFPKDIRALLRAANEHGLALNVLAAVARTNERQKLLLVERIVQRFGDDLSGRTFAVWGLAFKPDTDDVREAPSLTIVRALVRRGARLRLYDPAALAAARRELVDLTGLLSAENPYHALQGADALLIVTDWREFKSPDFTAMLRLLKRPVIFDGRNLFDPATMAALGFEYHAIGRPSALPALASGVAR